MSISHTKTIFLALLVATAPSLACDKEEDTSPAAKPNSGGAKAAGDAAKGDAAAAAPAAKGAEVVDEAEVDEVVKNPLDEKTAEALVTDAKEAAEAIEAARASIAEKKKGAAKKAVTKARKAMDRVMNERPTAALAVTLWTSKHELDSPVEEQTLDTVPLFASVDRIERRVASPEAVSRRKKDRASAKAGTVTIEEKRDDLALLDASLVYTELDMPIASTHTHVLAAQKLLGEGRLKEADEVLADAQASVELFEVVQQAPEFAARRDVWDAEAAFARGDMGEAKRLLGTATAALEPLAKADDAGEAGKVAKALIEEAAPLIKALEAGNAEHSTGLARIGRGMWGLSQRASAQVTLAARREQERFDLADALMYLEKAQTDGLYGGDDGAGGDLLLARAMLEAGAKKAPAATKPVVQDLSNRVEQLIDLDVAKDRDAAEIERRHRALKFDLRMLMFDLHFMPPLPSSKK